MVFGSAFLRVFFGLTAPLFAAASSAWAHPGPDEAEARYLANEGVMIVQDDLKILFDPLFDEGFGTYPLVPGPERSAIMAGEPPYDGIDAVFVSHLHGDHFSASATNAYLARNREALVVAPEQAAALMRAEANWNDQFKDRLVAIEVTRGEELAVPFPGPITVVAKHVRHSGTWEKVHNMVYRVSLGEGASVMHLGDADPAPRNVPSPEGMLTKETTDLALVPYWWLGTRDQDAKVRRMLNADAVIAIHVPTEVPDWLPASGVIYFSEPGETRAITISHDH